MTQGGMNWSGARDRDRGETVGIVPEKKLACGHKSKGVPQLSNPRRWWCCGAFQKGAK